MLARTLVLNRRGLPALVHVTLLPSSCATLIAGLHCHSTVCNKMYTTHSHFHAIHDMPLGFGSWKTRKTFFQALHRPAKKPGVHPVRGYRHSVVRARWVSDDGYTEEFCTVERNNEYWATRPIAATSRAVGIGWRFGRWLLETRLNVAGRQGADLSAIRAEKLRDVLVDLGPAFIKIAQAISARPDLVPPTYLTELEKLQDRVPSFPTPDAMQTLREELGRPVEEVFTEISQQPVAAASLGQVYKARLRDTGQLVAVKVQRPGVASAIGLDTHILRRLAGWFKQWRKLNSDLPGLLDEWTAREWRRSIVVDWHCELDGCAVACSLFKELDYRNEASNGLRFRELYGNMEGVYVPDMLLEYTTRRVLVMEWVNGERLRSGGSQGHLQGTLGSSADLALVDVGVRCSLEQMLECGLYHADPHLGNLLRTPDDKLCYLDFGMMGYVEPTIRRGLIRATLHLVNKEFEYLAEDFVTLGFLPPGSDKTKIVPALTGVFQAALANGASNLSFGDLGANLGTTMYKYSFRVPTHTTLLVRSLSILEGIALASDPGYKVMRAAYPWVARRLLTDRSQELRDTLLALLYKGGQFQFSRCESLLREAVKSPAQNTGGLAASGSAGGSPSVSRGDALSLLLSVEGQFLREIVVEELAKGVDAAWRVAADRAVHEARSSLTALLGMREQLPLRGAVTEQLLTSLRSVPTLSAAEDVEQIEGLQRLAAAIEITAGLDAQVAMGASANSLRATSELLQWLAAESAALTEQQRREALNIPFAVFNKVSSRVVARSLRLLLAPSPFTMAAAAANASAAAAESAQLQGSPSIPLVPSPSGFQNSNTKVQPRRTPAYRASLTVPSSPLDVSSSPLNALANTTFSASTSLPANQREVSLTQTTTYGSSAAAMATSSAPSAETAWAMQPLPAAEADVVPSAAYSDAMQLSETAAPLPSTDTSAAGLQDAIATAETMQCQTSNMQQHQSLVQADMQAGNMVEVLIIPDHEPYTTPAAALEVTSNAGLEHNSHSGSASGALNSMKGPAMHTLQALDTSSPSQAGSRVVEPDEVLPPLAEDAASVARRRNYI